MSHSADDLRGLLAISDLDLSRLDLRDVLDRVRNVLEADTAAVLLRESRADELVAHATCGLEEEVRQGVRVPLGLGFAGRIAATRQPVILDQVDATTVTSPILWLKGIRVMLGVPLLDSNEVVGVLHVGRLTEREFGQGEIELLELAAERVAAVIRLRRLADEAAAARLLEQSLLPASFPRLPRLEFAARYVPAESSAIGGDWYDAFVMPDGELWLVIGDVAGHGLHSAVVMGRVKSALRAYTLLDVGPARVLEYTDRKVQHFEIGTMVTVVCVTSRPPYDRFTICSAGHLPPVLAVPERGSELVDLPVGPPLGIVTGTPRAERTVDAPDGSVLLLYTDGLVERRHESIERGLRRLRENVYPDDPETVCRTVMRNLVGADMVDDDVAVFAVRRTA